MELRHRRRAFENGASVSAIRLQSLTHTTLRTPPRGCIVCGLSLRNGDHSLDKDFYRSLCPLRDFETLRPRTICCIASHRGDFLFCALSENGLRGQRCSASPS